MAASKKHLLAASAATALITLFGLAGPSFADPATAAPATASESSETEEAEDSDAPETTASVQQQIADKQAELAAVNEEYLGAKLELEKQNEAKAEAEATLAAAQEALAQAKETVANLGAEQFKSGSLPASFMLLAGESPSDFIDKANAQQQVNSYNDAKLTALAEAEAATEAAQQEAAEAQAAAAEVIETLTEKKNYIEAEIPKLQEQLASLTAQERAALDAAQGGTTAAAAEAAANPQAAQQVAQSATPAVAASGSAATVVNWAMSQRGKPYVWGGAGPNGYDCSGLVLAAFKQIGINLPHQSEAQAAYGTTVPFSALQPGDLVFAPGHVAIYIGNGTVVHAPTFGQPVSTMPMNYMSFYTAKRLV